MSNQFQTLINKTIREIDESCVNCVKIYFTDNTSVEIYSECGGDVMSIPYFEVCSVTVEDQE